MNRMRDVLAVTEGSPEKMAKHNLFETPRFFADVDHLNQQGSARLSRLIARRLAR